MRIAEELLLNSVFSAQRYAPVFVCIRPSQVILSKQLDGASWFLAWSLLSTYLIWCFKETEVYEKIRVLPSGAFS